MTHSQDAERLFSQYLERQDRGEGEDFDAFCRAHPDCEEELRRLRGEWIAVEGMISDLSSRYGSEEPSEEVSGYTLLGRLGQGGMGEVYLAEQKEPFRRRVVLKFIKLGMDTREVLARFEAERQALAQMNHPYIAQVYDAGVTSKGRPFFAMEYVAGQPLADFAEERLPELPARLDLFMRVCEGVQHAHQKGILHRDLKPTNILVTTQDGRVIPKIIDFGLAKAMDQPLTSETLKTRPELFLGTPAYMSPEQAGAVTSDIDTRSDVYSLGVVLYELLCDALPFEPVDAKPGSVAEYLRQLREEEPPPPSRRLGKHEERSFRARQKQVQGDLDWIVLKALEKERERRYASVSELAADVRRYLHHEVVSAGPPSTFYRVRKMVRRNLAAVVALAALVIALIGGLSVSLWFSGKAQNNARLARAEAERANYEAEKVLALSHRERLRELRLAADELWPTRPFMIPAMEEWIGQARETLGYLPQLHSFLQELRSEGVVADDQSVTFTDRRHQWLHDRLAELVAELDEFGDKERGLVAHVESRVRTTREHEKVSLVEAVEAWDDALNSIADVDLSPAYEGMLFEPQIGLVPLEPDPVTGFWEFLVVGSGEIPDRDPETDQWVMDGDAGMVVVLLPAGTFVSGADKENPRSPHYDSHASPEDTPPQPVTLAPFFLSKYEMTYAQWYRVMGSAPPHWQEPPTTEGPPAARIAAMPVNNMSWDDCADLTRRMGFVIPTDAQWEYAARGGTTTRWWTGHDPESLEGHENLADQTLKRLDNNPDYQYVPWEDGAAYMVEVGSYSPNPFGFYDVLGNVHEWTRDGESIYSVHPPEPGDGYRRIEADEFSPITGTRMQRGGAFYKGVYQSRVGRRGAMTRGTRASGTGLRPARPLEGEFELLSPRGEER